MDGLLESLTEVGGAEHPVVSVTEAVMLSLLDPNATHSSILERLTALSDDAEDKDYYIKLSKLSDILMEEGKRLRDKTPSTPPPTPAPKHRYMVPSYKLHSLYEQIRQLEDDKRRLRCEVERLKREHCDLSHLWEKIRWLENTKRCDRCMRC